MIASLNWSQQSELAHRLSKMWFRISNKNYGFISQITMKETRTQFYASMQEEIKKGQNPPVPGTTRLQADPEDGEDTPNNPSEHYSIPKCVTTRDITSWLVENQGDPALQVSDRPLSVVS
jgi:hypothetical protein